jgi:hypothetical protein
MIVKIVCVIFIIVLLRDVRGEQSEVRFDYEIELESGF